MCSEGALDLQGRGLPRATVVVLIEPAPRFGVTLRHASHLPPACRTACFAAVAANPRRTSSPTHGFHTRCEPGGGSSVIGLAQESSSPGVRRRSDAGRARAKEVYPQGTPG